MPRTLPRPPARRNLTRRGRAPRGAAQTCRHAAALLLRGSAQLVRLLGVTAPTTERGNPGSWREGALGEEPGRSASSIQPRSVAQCRMETDR